MEYDFDDSFVQTKFLWKEFLYRAHNEITYSLIFEEWLTSLIPEITKLKKEKKKSN